MRIITREVWGARPPRARHPIPVPTPKLYLHHAAGGVVAGDDTVSDADLRRIRSIQNYHMDVRGWSDIAYSYLTDPDGNVFEGRGHGIAGGHTAGQNTVSHAICVMGNYETQKPEEELLERIAALVVLGHQSGWWPPGITGGHRDAPGASTSCPGRYLYREIPTINQKVRELMETRFTDVPEDHTHYKSIEWLAANGITSGTNPPANDLFSPEKPVSRAEFATMLKRYHDKLGGV